MVIRCASLLSILALVGGSSFLAASPASRPTASYGRPTASASRPTASDGRPTASDGRPTASASRPTASDGRPTASDGRPTASDGRPTASDGRPTASDGRPTASRLQRLQTHEDPRPSSSPRWDAKPSSFPPKSNAKSPTSLPAGWKTVTCPEGRRYGMYCLGRIVGKEVRTEVVLCPLGKESFEVLIVKGMQAEGLDSDLRPHLGKFRQKEYIWMCPTSSYAGYAEDFHQPFDKKRMLDVLATFRRTYPTYEDIPASARFEAAALSYYAKGRKADFFAQFFVRAVWAAREEKEFRAETRFRRRAIAAFLMALQENLFPAKKQPSAMYLLAELLRQDGRFSHAKTWFERALLRTHDLARQTGSLGRGLEEMILAGKAKADQKDREVYVLPWSKKLRPSPPKKTLRLPWKPQPPR